LVAATFDTDHLSSEQIEMFANFTDYAADFPRLSFEQVAKKLGVDFSKAKSGKAWEKECREVFEREIAGSSQDRRGRWRARTKSPLA
jgi:hypothetical protein